MSLSAEVHIRLVFHQYQCDQDKECDLNDKLQKRTALYKINSYLLINRTNIEESVVMVTIGCRKECAGVTSLDVFVVCVKYYVKPLYI